MLLYKQDIISELEAELERIDQSEPRVLFHGSRRRDVNEKRLEVMKRLDAAVAEYGMFLFCIYLSSYIRLSLSLPLLLCSTCMSTKVPSFCLLPGVDMRTLLVQQSDPRIGR
jgi:hypothetical protein